MEEKIERTFTYIYLINEMCICSERFKLTIHLSNIKSEILILLSFKC